MKNAFDFEAKVIANKLEELAKMRPVPQEYGLPIFATDTVLGFPVETINNALQKHIKILRKSHWTKHKKQHCWSAYTHNNQILYCITALVGKEVHTGCFNENDYCFFCNNNLNITPTVFAPEWMNVLEEV